MGFRAVGNRAFGQRHDAIEAAIAALGAVIALAIFLVLFAPLAFDRNRAVVDVDFYVVFFQTRQIGTHDVVISALKCFHLGRPEAARALTPCLKWTGIAGAQAEGLPERRKRIAAAPEPGERVAPHRLALTRAALQPLLISMFIRTRPLISFFAIRLCHANTSLSNTSNTWLKRMALGDQMPTVQASNSRTSISARSSSKNADPLSRVTTDRCSDCS